MDVLLRPFQYDFFRNGLFVATISGALLGLVGVFVVLRSMSYIGHGLSHAIFGGYAVSGLLKINVLFGAGIWGFVSALMIGRIARKSKLGTDAIIGIVTTASFALGIVVLEVANGSPSKNFDAALFGSVYGVSAEQVVALVLVCGAVVIATFRFYRSLLFVTFDSDVAQVSGIRTAWFDAGIMAALAASVLVTMNVLGVTLIAATIVIPASVARLLTDSFARMLGLAVVIGAACGLLGMYASWFADVPSGPMITLVGAGAFVAAYVIAPRRRAGLSAHAH